MTLVKSRPVNYGAPMVLARMAGLKTHTRRIISKIPCQCGAFVPEEMSAVSNPEGFQMAGHSGRWWCDSCTSEQDAVNCPYGKPGDRLWVREAYDVRGVSSMGMIVTLSGEYVADKARFQVRLTKEESEKFMARQRQSGVSPARFMYRSLSRWLDEVVSIRVERLQEISEADAQAEGCERPVLSSSEIMGMKVHPLTGNYVDAYKILWESIHGPGSWATNPWVWVIEFKQLKK